MMTLDKITTILNQKNVIQTSILLVCMILFSSIGYQYHKLPIPLELPKPPEPKQNAHHNALPKIQEFHIFGHYIEEAADKPHAMPETTLDLSLKGILAAGQYKQGSAIISANHGADKIYQVGDLIPGGAKLIRVYKDRVILSRSGQLETLLLPVAKPLPK